MRESTIRSILRWGHIVLGLIIMFYIYSPFGEKRFFQIMMKFGIIPIITFTGIWMWQFRAFNKFLRIRP